MKDIRSLFEKYLNRTASSEELEELFHILQNKSDFEALHELFEEEWESKDVQFFLDNTTWEKMQSGMDDRKRDHPSIRPKGVKNYDRYWRLAGVAASVLVLIGLMLWFGNHSGERIYETGYGETLEITLEDQSHIILNANSKLTWHSDWKMAGERWVELEGEAFFDVSHQALPQVNDLVSPEDSSALMPFRVNTPDLTVNVLGTSFNVMARRQKTDVYLKTGRVVLTMNNSQKSDSSVNVQKNQDFAFHSDRDTIYMLPGDHVSYSAKVHRVAQMKTEPEENQASWTKGHLIFENQRLETALEDLEDIYGKKFEVADSTLLDRPVDLGLPYEDWETVSGLMTLSLEIEFIETGNKVIVKRK